MKDLGYIEMCCPHCGKKIFLNVTLKVYEEIYREVYNCSCGKNFKVEYDSVLAELNINIGIYLIDK